MGGGGIQERAWNTMARLSYGLTQSQHLSLILLVDDEKVHRSTYIHSQYPIGHGIIQVWLYSSSSLGVHFRAMVDLHGRCTISSLITMQSCITMCMYMHNRWRIFSSLLLFETRMCVQCTCFTVFYSIQSVQCFVCHGVTILQSAWYSAEYCKTL